MAIEHWTTAYLTGANASFQRAAREYAEEYAAMAVAAERERCARLCESMDFGETPENYAWTIRTEWASDDDEPDTSAPVT